MTTQKLKREYQRMRRNIQRRISTIGKTEFSQTQTYKYGRKAFFDESASLKGKSRSQIEKMLSSAERFLKSGTTLSEMKKKRKNTIKQINARFGENILNNDNYFQFIEFMNDKAIEDIAKWLESDQVVELFKMKDKGLSQRRILKDWADLLDNSEDINDYLDSLKKSGKKVNSRKIREILND